MYVPLFKRLSNRLAPFNEEVVRGLAYSHLTPQKVMRHVDNIIRCMEETFPEGLHYVGSRRCTPYEEYREALNYKVDGKRVFDIARSSIYLVRYEFSYRAPGTSEAIPLYPVHLYLPYTLPGNLLYLSGKLFSISPVMTDRVFSVKDSEIFLPLNRAKVTFRRKRHEIRRNGVLEAKHVMWSWLHNKGGKGRSGQRGRMVRSGKVFSTGAHYMFCRFGFYQTFERYFGFKPVVVREADYRSEDWPADKYVTYSSSYRNSTRKPSAVTIQNYREVATDLMVIVPLDKCNEVVELLVAGFYYVVDHFPESIQLEDLDDESNWMWQVVMGYIIFGDHHNQGKVGEDVITHLNSLDGYVDQQAYMDFLGVVPENPASIDRLNTITDMYDVIMYIVDRMPTMLLGNAGRPACLYDKQLVVRRFALSNINNNLFDLLFELKSCRGVPKTADDFNKILRNHFKVKAIFGLISGQKGQRHGEISSVSNPSDNMFFKISSAVLQQSESTGGTGNDINVFDPENHLDASYAEVTGFGVLSKSSPVGKAKLSPWIQIDDDGNIVRREEYRELLDDAQRDISRI